MKFVRRRAGRYLELEFENEQGLRDVVEVYSRDRGFIERLAVDRELAEKLYRVARLIEEIAEALHSDAQAYVYPDNFTVSVTRDFDGALRIRVEPSVWFENA